MCVCVCVCVKYYLFFLYIDTSFLFFRCLDISGNLSKTNSQITCSVTPKVIIPKEVIICSYYFMCICVYLCILLYYIPHTQIKYALYSCRYL